MHKTLNTVTQDISRLFVWFITVTVTNFVCVYHLVRVLCFGI